MNTKKLTTEKIKDIIANDFTNNKSKYQKSVEKIIESYKEVRSQKKKY